MTKSVHNFWQLWNSKLSSKSKLYGKKKTVIPVAQIEYVKSAKSARGGSGIQKTRESGSETVLRKKKSPISSDRTSKDTGGKRDTGKITITAKLKTNRNSKSKGKISLEKSDCNGNGKEKEREKGKGKEKRASKRNIEKEEDVICPFDSLVFLGDLNYRLELPRLEVTAWLVYSTTIYFRCNRGHN